MLTRLNLSYADLRVLLPLLTLAAERAVHVSYEPGEQHVIHLRDGHGEIEVFFAGSLGGAVRRATEFLSPATRFGHDFGTCLCKECAAICKSWEEYNENRV